MTTLAKSENSSELNLIATGTIFEGKLKTPGSIRIDGRIVGEVVAIQNVAVGQAGDVDGNISAKNITVGGKINGLVVAQEKLVLESKAVLKGDIRAAKLVIDEGATFDGKCMMSNQPSVLHPLEHKPEVRKGEER